MFALFMAAVMTVSALPVTARILQNFNLYKTDLGFLIMSALTVNDILGWVAFTLILGFFTSSEVNFMNATVIILATTGFTFLCLSYGRLFTNKVISGIQKVKLPEPGSSLTFIVLLGLACGTMTALIGINALFGFFIAGIMAGEARALSEKTRQVISQMVYSIFVPLFFATIGLNLDVLKNFDFMIAAFVFTVGTVGRFAGAWVGVLFTKQPRSNILLISLSHVAGGEMQIVVSMIALHAGLITQTVFVSIIFGTLASSVSLGPLIAYALKIRKQVSFLEFFARENIISEINANDKDSALRELCSHGAASTNLTQAEVYDLVKKREDEMSTGLEEGLAVPHARIRSIDKPVVIFGRSESGIEWNSPDGKPAKLVFLILTPFTNEDSQVQILRNIVRGLRNEASRNQIISAFDSREILDVLKDIFKDACLKNKTAA
jgi:mannitol/fructose-specific phosphotransferase system IIA component (Ntr-type)